MLYQYMRLNVSAQSLSPLIDNPSFDLHFAVGGGTPALSDVTALMNTVVTALTSPGIIQIPGAYFGPSVSRATNGALIKAYDVTSNLHATPGVPTGGPVAQLPWTVPDPVAGSSQLPEGVCAVITEQCPYGTDVEFGPGTRPRARDRGRIYFGPIDGLAIGKETTTNRAILTNVFINDMLNFAGKLGAASGSGLRWFWSVWSRRDGAFKTISEVWIDERPDYQRRRVDQGVTKHSAAIVQS
jgi:hypothetical protein